MIGTKIEIAKTERYTILYDPKEKLFILNDADNNEMATAVTQERVEVALKQLEKQSFKLPVPALINRYSGVYQGRITSVNLHRETAYFAYDDKKYGRTEKLYLRYGSSGCFELTESNSKIAAKITGLLAQISELKTEIEGLTEQFETPINVSYFKGKGKIDNGTGK